jgi:hypothetical protein
VKIIGACKHTQEITGWESACSLREAKISHKKGNKVGIFFTRYSAETLI